MKKAIIALVFILVFSLVFRVPIYEQYPNGYDTFVNYKLATDIIEKSYIGWTLNPLSLTGFYPLSYQTAGISLLSIISSVTGLSVSTTILVIDYFLVVCLGILFYLIAIELFRNTYLAILSTLIFLNTRFLIYFTSWYYTTRDIFMLFFIFLLFIMVRKNFKNKPLLAMMLLFFLLISHKMIIFIPLIFLAYLVSISLKESWYRSKYFPYIVLILTVGLFLGSVLFIDNLELGSTESPPFHVGNPIIDKIISIGFIYSLQIGILFILFPIGYAYLLFKRKKLRSDVFILMVFLLFSPFFQEQTYASYLLLPFIVIGIIYFFQLILTLKLSELPIFKIATFGVVLILLILPLYITVVSDRNRESAEGKTIALKNYLANNIEDKKIVCNFHTVYCNQVTALSDNKVQSLSELNALMNVDKFNVTDTSINFRFRGLYQFKDPIFNVDYYGDIYEFHIIRFYVYPSKLEQVLLFTETGYILDSNKPDSVANRNRLTEKYGDLDRIYDNDLQQIRPIPWKI